MNISEKQFKELMETLRAALMGDVAPAPLRRGDELPAVTLRPDGRYQARYCVGGKQYSVYGKTEAEALERRKAAFAERSERYAAAAYSLFEWLDYWNATYRRPFTKTDVIGKHIKNHIKVKLKDKPLTKVTTAELQAFLNGIQNSRTQTDLFYLLRGAFSRARLEKLINDKPGRGAYKTSAQAK